MILVERRYRGPARSGNGGYTSGLLAVALRQATGATTATVTLQVPPPLDQPMALKPHGAGLRLLHGETVVAEVAPGEFTADVVGPVSYAAAETAQTAYPGFRDHPFPGCFTCGPAREPGDGLRLFPGPVAEDVVAAAWTVRPEFAGDGTAGTAVVWAALDCPGGWSVDLAGRPMVLGRMTGQVDAVPAVGQRCVVVGHRRAEQGRKALTDSALYDTDGRLLARAEATWIAVDPATFEALMTDGHTD
ncbi:MAG TPA: hypothetical protein VGR21_02790 [Cryptosporangiaceae bacterium]|nr:hypothetical protein [Cryptosporangiaceae bacterium]